DEAWNPQTNLFTFKAVVGFTPSRTYVRVDCPRYGALVGPSCQTAPEVSTAPDLMPALGSMGYASTPGLSENRPNLAPPRGSVRGVPDEPPPAPPAVTSPLPAEPPGPEPSPAPAGVQPQAAVIGGNVGPVGSRQEKYQLGRIVGGQATAAIELLLGPLARGTTVHIAPDPG